MCVCVYGDGIYHPYGSRFLQFVICTTVFVYKDLDVYEGFQGLGTRQYIIYTYIIIRILR